MEKVKNPCIASIFMDNIDKRSVELQVEVVKKFNKSNIAHYPVLSQASPGYTMDKLVDMLEKNYAPIEQWSKFKFTLSFICIPKF